MWYCLFLLPKVTVKLENQIAFIPSSYLSALCLCLPSAWSLTWKDRGLHHRSREHSRALVRCMGSKSKLRTISFKWVISRLVKRYLYTWVRPRHAISGTNHTEGCAANQTYGKASLYPQSELALQSWLSGAGQSDGSAQNQEWNGPIDWAFEWLLIVLRAEGKPLFSCLAWLWWERDLVISLVIEVPPRHGQLPNGVLAIATGPVSVPTQSLGHIVQKDKQCS